MKLITAETAIESALLQGATTMTSRLDTQTVGHSRWSATTQVNRSRNDNRYPEASSRLIIDRELLVSSRGVIDLVRNSRCSVFCKILSILSGSSYRSAHSLHSAVNMIAGDTPAATVPAYAVQKHCAAVWRKNFHRQRTVGGAESANHSVHSRRWYRAGYLGGERARVRCRG